MLESCKYLLAVCFSCFVCFAKVAFVPRTHTANTFVTRSTFWDQAMLGKTPNWEQCFVRIHKICASLFPATGLRFKTFRGAKYQKSQWHNFLRNLYSVSFFWYFHPKQFLSLQLSIYWNSKVWCKDVVLWRVLSPEESVHQRCDSGSNSSEFFTMLFCRKHVKDVNNLKPSEKKETTTLEYLSIFLD